MLIPYSTRLKNVNTIYYLVEKCLIPCGNIYYQAVEYWNQVKILSLNSSNLLPAVSLLSNSIQDPQSINI